MIFNLPSALGDLLLVPIVVEKLVPNMFVEKWQSWLAEANNPLSGSWPLFFVCVRRLIRNKFCWTGQEFRKWLQQQFWDAIQISFYINLCCLFTPSMRVSKEKSQVWSEFCGFCCFSIRTLPNGGCHSLLARTLYNVRYHQIIQCSRETHRVEACFKIQHWNKLLPVNMMPVEKSRWAKVYDLREVHSCACVHEIIWTKPPCKVHGSGPPLLRWVWHVLVPRLVLQLKGEDF